LAKYLTSASRVLFRTYKGSDYATWLRGMAALGVLIIHYGGLGLRELFPPNSIGARALNNLVDFGGQGPTIFFVASGYVLHKYVRKSVPNWKIFLTRYLRLAPAYTLVLWFATIVNGSLEQFSVSMFVKKLLFLDLFFKDAYEFNPIGIGYFVVVEFWLTAFLLLGPVLTLGNGLKRKITLISIVLSSFLLSYYSHDLATWFDIPTFHFDILKYQFFFILGMCCVRLRLIRNVKIPARVLAVISIVLALNFDQYLGYVAAMFAITTLLSEDEKGSRIPLGITPIFIGNICYSIYLLHIPMISLFQIYFAEVSIFIVVCSVITLSCLLFIFIEQPFIKIGKRFTTKAK